MPRPWRVSLIGRLFSLVLSSFSTVVLVALTTSIVREEMTMNLFYGLLTGSGFMVGPILMGLRPSVTLTESELVVRNPLRTSESS